MRRGGQMMPSSRAQSHQRECAIALIRRMLHISLHDWRRSTPAILLVALVLLAMSMLGSLPSAAANVPGRFALPAGRHATFPARTSAAVSGWSNVTPLPSPRAEAAAATGADGRVYL